MVVTLGGYHGQGLFSGSPAFGEFLLLSLFLLPLKMSIPPGCFVILFQILIWVYILIYIAFFTLVLCFNHLGRHSIWVRRTKNKSCRSTHNDLVKFLSARFVTHHAAFFSRTSHSHFSSFCVQKQETDPCIRKVRLLEDKKYMVPLMHKKACLKGQVKILIY